MESIFVVFFVTFSTLSSLDHDVFERSMYVKNHLGVSSRGAD